MAINEKAFTGYFGRAMPDPQMPLGWPREFMLNGFVLRFRAQSGLDSRQRNCGYGLWRSPWKLRRRNSLECRHYDLAAIDPEFLGGGLWAALCSWHAYQRNYAQYLVGPVRPQGYRCSTPKKLGWRPAPDVLS
jgi:hypothetical protein